MADNGNDKQQNPGPFGFKFKNNRFALILLVAIFGIFIVLLSSPGRQQGMEIEYSTFLNYVEQDQVESVTIVDQYEIRGRLRGMSGDNALFRTQIPYFDD